MSAAIALGSGEGASGRKTMADLARDNLSRLVNDSIRRTPSLSPQRMTGTIGTLSDTSVVRSHDSLGGPDGTRPCTHAGPSLSRLRGGRLRRGTTPAPERKPVRALRRARSDVHVVRALSLDTRGHAAGRREGIVDGRRRDARPADGRVRRRRGHEVDPHGGSRCEQGARDDAARRPPWAPPRPARRAGR